MGVFSYFKNFLDNIKFGFLENKKHVNLGRVYVVLVFFIFCYFIISLRLFDLTILKAIPDEQEFANSFVDKSSVNFDRGDIFDRNGELLAVNLITTSIYANPRVIENPKTIAKKLAKIFPNLEYKNLAEKLQSDKAFVWIKRNISPKEELIVNNEGIPGIYFRFGKRRAYPQGALFSHIVGYVGLDGDGLMGAESYFDKFLKSRHEDRKLQNLHLSLEVRAQSIVREELQKAVKEFRAKGAVGILQDITNGEVIAMVSLPDYDPNDISSATEHELFNKATLGNYEVGSVFKVFTMAAALDSGIVKLHDVYDVDTPLKSGGFYIKDFYGKKGWLSVPQILMYSSNIGIAQIALEIGKERQFQAIKSLGLLSETEIELPERAVPVFRDISRWSDTTSIAASYGYGISISPLHVSMATGAVANGGRLFTPTILKDADNEYKQVIKKSTSDKMRKLLRTVVRFGAGKAAVEGLYVGGKSGTANKPVNGVYSNHLRVSSFVSIFPSNDPKYVLYVMLDEPKSTKETFGFATGGWVAAPTTKNIIKRIATLFDIVPQIKQKEAIENSLFVQYNPKSISS